MSIPPLSEAWSQLGSADPVTGAEITCVSQLVGSSYVSRRATTGTALPGLTFTNNFEGGGFCGVFYTDQFARALLAPAASAASVDTYTVSFQAAGGTPGFTQNNARWLTVAGRLNENFVWGTLSALTDDGPATGQNVAGYCQTIKTGLGTSGAFVAELIDTTVSPEQGSVSVEIDLRATGADANQNRATLHQVFSNPNSDNAAYEVERGQKFTILGTGGFVHRVIDFSSVTSSNSDYLIFHPNFTITGAGTLTTTGQSITEGGLEINRASSSPPSASRLDLQIDGVGAAFLQADSSSQASLGLVAGNGVTVVSGAIHPLADNVSSLGASSFRWSTVYAATGTINTSDARQKTGIGAPGDDVLDAVGDIAPAIFQMLDSVAVKGDDARIHAGVTAQRLAECFRVHGLDPARYAVFCSDPVLEPVEITEDVLQKVMEAYEEGQWEHTVAEGVATRRRVNVTKHRPVIDMVPVVGEDGVPVVTPARAASIVVDEKGNKITVTGRPEIREMHPVERTETVKRVRTEMRPSTSEFVLGVRYDQLLVLAHGWSRREIDRLHARISALEGAK